jgi:predicted regulator of Ras-like GTPase activity (Roadblock/LC7/MglB family)
MSFREILKRIVESTDRAIGVVLMGYDGISIDEFIIQKTAVDVTMLTVEYSTLLKEIKRTVDVLKTGNLEEVSIFTGDLCIVIRAISEEFFLVLLLEKEGNFGKGRYLLKLNTPAFAEMLQG